jgi:hypothetical protein
LFERGADVIGAAAIAENRRQFSQANCGHINIGQFATKRVRGANALASQREIGPNTTGRARQQERRANIGKEPNTDFRHRDRRALCDDTMGRVRRQPDAATHYQSVHHRNDRFCVTCDEDIEPVFGRPKARREGVTRLRYLVLAGHILGSLVKRADVAAGAKAALAGPIEQHRADGRVGGPSPQQRRHGERHVERNGIQGLRAIERDAAQRAVAPHDQIIVAQKRFTHRPTRLLATMRRMISLVPSRI